MSLNWRRSEANRFFSNGHWLQVRQEFAARGRSAIVPSNERHLTQSNGGFVVPVFQTNVSAYAKRHMPLRRPRMSGSSPRVRSK